MFSRTACGFRAGSILYPSYYQQITLNLKLRNPLVPVPGGRGRRKTLDLNPGSGIARSVYASLLAHLGRASEAYSKITRALEDEPFSAEVNRWAINVMYCSRQSTRPLPRESIPWKCSPLSAIPINRDANTEPMHAFRPPFRRPDSAPRPAGLGKHSEPLAAYRGSTGPAPAAGTPPIPPR